MRRDVQQAIDEAARLAEHIYSPSLEMGNLAAALRAAAVSARTPASVEVEGTGLAARSRADRLPVLARDARAPPQRARATISVREGEGALSFEIVADTSSEAGFEGLRDRVEALGGRLTIRPESGHGVRLSGSLPLSR